MVFSLILELRYYERKSAKCGNEDEKVKLLFDHYQLIGRNAENNEKELLKKKKNMIYQGMNANHKTIK